jgi:small subunit ribosomal protein S16
MAVKMRLQRHGRTKAPFYHIVIADSRSPRDGKYIQKIGTYNPLTVPATIDIDREAAFDWLNKGAQPTDTVQAILRFKGVMFKKHLQRGVKKGALTQEQADAKLLEFVTSKDSAATSRASKTKEAKAAYIKAVNGVAKAPKVKEVPVVEAAAEPEAVVEETAAEETSAE